MSPEPEVALVIGHDGSDLKGGGSTGVHALCDRGTVIVEETQFRRADPDSPFLIVAEARYARVAKHGGSGERRDSSLTEHVQAFLLRPDEKCPPGIAQNRKYLRFGKAEGRAVPGV